MVIYRGQETVLPILLNKMVINAILLRPIIKHPMAWKQYFPASRFPKLRTPLCTIVSAELPGYGGLRWGNCALTDLYSTGAACFEATEKNLPRGLRCIARIYDMP